MLRPRRNPRNIIRGTRSCGDKSTVCIISVPWFHLCIPCHLLSPHLGGQTCVTKLTPPRKPVDPYSRLRVPKYQKIFEAIFFATFLALYYAVLLERHPERLGFFEVLLYIWIAAFAYDEFGEFRDAGHLFYAADFWSLWDLGIILVGIAFMIARTSLSPC